ncbi:MAG TPA: YceI family protein [Blastocatellia bacterium]|nr:YceI family protein [Blastocatellia bacterium]
MIKTAFSFVLLVSSVLVAAPMPAPHIIDQAHSQINFVAEARFISAHGSFDKWEADVSLDRDKIENSTVKITIDATSINTRVERRDNHLRSKDFFDVAQYPTITFTSKKVTKTGDKNYTLVGDLALHGVTKEITVPVEMVFYDNNRGRFRSTFQLNRKEYGITYDSKMNSIADMVQVQFDINVLDKAAVEKAQKEREAAQKPKPNN